MPGGLIMLKGKAVAVNNLTLSDVKNMFRIMQIYYENITETNFISDLLNKQDVVLLFDENGKIRGFTTLAIFFYDKSTQLLYSGDTIVEKEYWGNHDLMRVWIQNAMKHSIRFSGETYWLLLSKGYKTYKYLTSFFNEYYPSKDAETPLKIQKIIDNFAVSMFGEKYNNGIYNEGKDYLKAEFAEIDERQLKDKNVAFFLEKNPGYRVGNELVCIAKLSKDNLNRLGRRILDE
jgi:hypothetical protein